MGKVVSKRTYEYHEYITACMISVGVTLFLLNSGDVTRHKGTVTTISGVILLAGYMWEKTPLFKKGDSGQ
jgi:adenosine 3'-phospho 5'-phosphosulfate transporter B2